MTIREEIKDIVEDIAGANERFITIDEAIDLILNIVVDFTKKELWSLHHNEDDSEDRSWNEALDLAITRMEKLLK